MRIMSGSLITHNWYNSYQKEAQNVYKILHFWRTLAYQLSDETWATSDDVLVKTQSTKKNVHLACHAEVKVTATR